MSANLPAFQNFTEGFRSAFMQGTEDSYNLVVEYLDIGRSQDDAYVRHIVEMYNEKLKNASIDLIITFPPYTFSLLEKYGLDALKTTPVLKIESDPPMGEGYQFSKDENIYELKAKFRIAETLDVIFKLFPDHKQVYVIDGNTPIDHFFSGLVDQSSESFKPSFQFNFISGITLDSTIKIVEDIPETGIVIIPMYLADLKNISFSTPEAISIIASHCNAPVFPLFDSFIKSRGGIGGFVFSYTALGKESGKVAFDLLQGKAKNEIWLDEKSYYKNIYDWQQLKKWGIEGSDVIPENSQFINKNFDFFATYKWQIFALVMVLISETILIIYLYKLTSRQKEVVRQRTESEQLYRQVIREDRLSRMSELTASLSHELNQPLTAILYNAQAGLRFIESGKLDNKQAGEIFENIIEDDKRAGSLISSVRSLMKLETREKDKVSLNLLIQDTVAIFYAEAVQQHIRIRVRNNEKTIYVFGDKIQLQQVLLNFLANAAIAMKNTEPEKKIIELRQELVKDWVVVSVRDTGPGIEDSIRDKIFKPFVTSSASGFGIGLAVSSSIIQKHEGEIRAENLPQGGAEFSFKLPVFIDKNE
jgi:signal transduction histidine kinase